jgi:hypothetical protein
VEEQHTPIVCGDAKRCGVEVVRLGKIVLCVLRRLGVLGREGKQRGKVGWDMYRLERTAR